MRFFTSRAAAILASMLALAPLGAARAETYGAWETKQIEGLFVAQTVGPSISLHVVCPQGRPDLITANLVTDAPVPAYRNLPGPVASFDFDARERLQFRAVQDEASKSPDRVFRLAANSDELRALIAKLRRAARVGVVVIGGPSFEEARLARAELSLKGSSKALDAIRRGCR